MQYVLDRILSVYNDKVIYKDGEDNCVVLYYADDTAQKIQLLREGYILTMMEKHMQGSITVPEFRGIQKIDEKWGLVISYQKGTSLDRMVVTSPAGMEFSMKKLATIQVYLHGIREEALPVSEMIPGEENGVCHGTLDPRAVIVGADGKDYVMFWDKTTYGNISLDAARTMLKLQFLYGKESAELYLKHYCQLRGISKDVILQKQSRAAELLAHESNKQEAAFYRSLQK